MEAMNGVMPVYNLADNRNDSGFGGDNSWMMILIFFVLFGFGGNGFGGNKDAMTANTITAENLLAQTSRINENILTAANGTNSGICNATYATNNSIRDLGAQLAQCCCDMRFEMSQGFCGVNRNIDNLRYEMADKFCTVYNNQAKDTAAILQAIHNTACEDQIRDLERENLRLSQAGQTSTLLNAMQDICGSRRCCPSV